MSLTQLSTHVKPRRRTARFNARPYLFLLPVLVLFAVFMYYPIVQSLLMAFQRSVGGETQWAGVGQFQRLAGDTLFRTALLNTLLFLVIQVPVMLLLALSVAVNLNRKHFPLRSLFQSVYFLPSIMGLVAAGILFRLFFNEQLGLINYILNLLGLPGGSWTSQPAWAQASVMILMTWKNLGAIVVIYLAGLQAIPEELYEAAELDGARGWQVTRYITLPLLKPSLVFTMILATIGVLNVFDEVVVLTGGGPANGTLTLGLYLYRTAFQNLDFNYGAAIAWAIVLLVALLSALQWTLSRGDD